MCVLCEYEPEDCGGSGKMCPQQDVPVFTGCAFAREAPESVCACARWRPLYVAVAVIGVFVAFIHILTA